MIDIANARLHFEGMLMDLITVMYFQLMVSVYRCQI